MTKTKSTYGSVKRIQLASLLVLVAVALTFIGFHPMGDFEPWMAVTVFVLGGVAVFLTAIRIGMQLENPAND